MSGALSGLQERLRQLHEQWAQFPGRAPNGTGLTGLASNDSLGYSKMLNEQTEGMNLENEMEGRAPVTVRYGGEVASQLHGIADDPQNMTATGPYGLKGPSQGMSAALGALRQAGGYQDHESFMSKLGKKLGPLGR